MTDIVDKRLKPDAEQGNDMLALHIRSGLTRNELLAEVFVIMCVAQFHIFPTGGKATNRSPDYQQHGWRRLNLNGHPHDAPLSND